MRPDVPRFTLRLQSRPTRCAALAALATAVALPLTGVLPAAAMNVPPHQLVPTPLPMPSLPTTLPGLGPSPSPTPSPRPTPVASTGGSGGGTHHPGNSVTTGGPFGPGGIASAFTVPAAAAASTAAGTAGTAAQPFRPTPPPPILPYLLPNDRSSAVQSAVPPLLLGLLLISLGLWLVAMRHRRQALQTAALERTKTDFLNLASHELRGPLTILKGYISTAREGHFGELPDAFATRLPTVQAQLARMELLVEQMLETARLDAGHPDVQREPADLRRVVRDALPAERLEGSEHRVEVEAPDFPVIADVDEKRIEQVLRNLIDNAIKYSDAPAHVTVRLSTDAGSAQVSVTDRGHGIAPEDMRRLFSRFGRLVTDKNSHVPGVGLGLYLGREVARRHGGDLEGTSELGRGSTFTLTLPLQSHDDAARSGAAAETNPLQRAVRSVSRRLPNKARE